MTGWTNEPGVVEFPDGRKVRGFGMRTGRGDVPPPDFTLFLLTRRPPPPAWDHQWLRWPDFWVPATHEAVSALRETHDRASDERVEIACRGGKGRTGTALALMAVMSGVAADEAVNWVRSRYDHQAIETPWQRRWILRAASELNES